MHGDGTSIGMGKLIRKIAQVIMKEYFVVDKVTIITGACCRLYVTIAHVCALWCCDL